MLFLCRIILLTSCRNTLIAACKQLMLEFNHWCMENNWYCNAQSLHTMIDHIPSIGARVYDPDWVRMLAHPKLTYSHASLHYYIHKSNDHEFDWVCNANLYWSFMKKLPIRCRSRDITSCGHTSRIASHPLNLVLTLFHCDAIPCYGYGECAYTH